MKCSGGGEAPEIGFAEARGPADRRGEDLLECGERNLGQRHAAVDHAARELARDFVRLAERDRLRAHQGIGKLGQRNAGFVDMPAHFGAVDLDRREQSAQQRHQPMRRVERLVAGDLHFALGIVHVGERRVVHGRQHRFAARRAQRRHQPQMLHRYGIALLRHDRADLDESVGHVQVSDLESGPGIEVLHEPPGVDEQQLERRVDAGGVIGGGDAAIGILLHFGKPQQLGHARAVEPEARRRDRRRSHAAEIDGARGVKQPVHVAQRQLDERGKIVAVGRGLRRLSVGIGDDDGFALALGDRQQCLDHRGVLGEKRRQPVLERQLEHGVVDVVAASPGVQLAGDVDAQAADQLAFDIEEEILVLAGIDEAVEVDGLEDVVERLEDCACLFVRQQPAFGQQHGARLVDLHLIAPVMALHAFEQRGEDGVLVDPRRKFLVVCFLHALMPANAMPRMM